MKKALLLIPTVVCIFVGIIIYYITPNESVQFNKAAEGKSLPEVLLNMSSINLKDKDLELVLDESNLSDIIASTKAVNEFKADIADDRLIIYTPTKLGNIINTYYKVTFDMKAEDGKVALKILNSSLGKLSISNDKVLSYLQKSNTEEFQVDMNKKTIYIINPYVYFNSVEIKDDKISLWCQLEKNSLIDILGGGLDKLKEFFSK